MKIFPGLLAAFFATQAAADGPLRADFKSESASAETRHVANWVVHSGDNKAGDDRALNFVIVDKAQAKVFVFDSEGRLRGAAPALLGMAIGDTAVPGIGERELSSIKPAERTTPAGRFVAQLGESTRKEDVLWVDYAGAVSMHRVIKTKDRLQRLASPSTADNRISFGCINIPAKFYETVVRPAFEKSRGIVYVLPETRLARELFSSYDVEEFESRKLQPQ
jgi:hypothetical protein